MSRSSVSDAAHEGSSLLTPPRRGWCTGAAKSNMTGPPAAEAEGGANSSGPPATTPPPTEPDRATPSTPLSAGVIKEKTAGTAKPAGTGKKKGAVRVGSTYRTVAACTAWREGHACVLVCHGVTPRGNRRREWREGSDVLSLARISVANAMRHACTVGEFRHRIWLGDVTRLRTACTPMQTPVHRRHTL